MHEHSIEGEVGGRADGSTHYIGRRLRRSPRDGTVTAARDGPAVGRAVRLLAVLALAVAATAPATAEAPRGGTITGVVRRGAVPSAARVEARRCRAGPAPRIGSEEEGERFFEGLMRIEGVLGPPVASARAGADGVFVLDGLEAGGYEVEAFLDDGGAAFSRVEVPAVGARVAADVTVPPGGSTLRGRARRGDGTPFRGWIAVCPFTPVDEHFSLHWERMGVPVETAADGTFAVRDLPAGQVFLVAVAPPTFLRLFGFRTLPAAGEVVLETDAASAPVAGRVIEEEGGAGIPDALVTVQAGAGRGVSFLGARTAPDGAFRVAAPGAKDRGARVSVSASAPGHEWVRIESTAEAAGAGVVVRLPRLARVVGRALAPGGKPAAGARVFARGASPDRREEQAIVSAAFADAEGRFVIHDAPAGLVSVFVAGPRWASNGLDLGADRPFDASLVVVPPTAPVAVDRVVVPAARLLVRVADATGAPVARAVVRARAAGDRFHSAAPPAVALVADAVAGCGEDGSCALEGLVPDALYRVSVEAVGHAPFDARTVRVASGETREVAVRLPPSRRLTVRVRDAEEGRPIAGARVAAGTLAAVHGASGRTAWTDASGVAVLPVLPPGEIVVAATAEGFRTPREGVPASIVDGNPSELRADVTLVAGATLAGTVVLPHSLPAGTAVRLWLMTERYSRLSAVGADGVFRFTGLEPGRYSLATEVDVDGTEYAAAGVFDTGREDVVLTMAARPDAERPPSRDSRTTSWRARVVDPSGAPVPRARASVRVESDCPTTYSTSVEDGVLAVDVHGTIDRVTVEVHAARNAHGLPLPLGPVAAGPFTAEDKDIVIRLPAGRSVSGRVVGPDGKGVAGACVLSLPAGEAGFGRSMSGVRGWALTAADGAFEVGGLAEGECSLEVEPPPGYVTPDPLPARAGETGVEIRLKAAGRFVLRIVDVLGKPVAAACVRFAGDRRLVDAVSDDDGTAPLFGLDPGGVYDFSVEPPEGNFDLGDARVHEWKPVSATVTLPPLFAIEGVVRDPAGKALADAYVKIHPVFEEGAEPPDIPYKSFADAIRTDREGRFRTRGLPKDSVVNVVASLEEYPALAERKSQAVRAKAGAKDVVVTLDPGVPLVVRVEGIEGSPGRLAVTVTEWPDGPFQSALLGVDFRARFVGLAAGRPHAVWVGRSTDGRYGYATGVVPGPQEVVVRMVPGKPIEGRVVRWDGLAPELDRISVRVEGAGVRAYAEVEPTGKFRVAAVPDGTWKVVVSYPRAWEDAVTVEAAAGSVLEITIPKPDGR